MTKKVLVVMSLLMLVLVSSTGFSATKKTKITWWTHQRHDMDFMQAKVAEFNKTNKDGIEIEYVIQTENYSQNLELAFQSGQAPDIFSGFNNAKYYADRNMAMPLNRYLTTDIKNRYGNFLYVETEGVVNGKIYSLSNAGVNFRLIYNLDLFKKANLPGPPKSIAEMVAYAKKITEVGKDEKAYGFAINMKNPYTALFRSMDQIAKRSGAWPYDYRTGKFTFEPMKPIILAFKQMKDDGSTFPGIENLDIDPMRSQFAEGKIGMYISGNWEPGVYEQQFPAKINWAAAPVPTIDGTVKGKTWVRAGRWQFISSQSKKIKLVWKVYDWFHRDEILVPYHEGGYGYTVVPSVAKKAKDPNIKGASYFKLDEKVDAIWPSAPHEEGLQVEGRTYYDVIAMVILGLTPVDDAIKDLNKRYNDALDKGEKAKTIRRPIIKNFDPLKL